MYFLLLLLSFLIFPVQSKQIPQNKPIKKTDCIRVEDFGDISVCLPKFKDLTECYYTPIVNERAKKYDLEGNVILGLYLNDNTYSKIDKLNDDNFDDYVKIYSPKSLMNVKIEEQDLDKLSEMMTRSFINKNWQEIQDEIESELDEFEIKKPVIVENNSINKSIRNLIVLNTVATGERKVTMVCSLNMVLIKNRVIFLSYYKFYNGRNSIDYLRNKNIELVTKFLKYNK